MIETLRRLIKQHRRASLHAEGRVASLDSPRIARTKGSAGAAELRFGQDVPLSVELEQALARYAGYWEARLQAETPAEERRVTRRAILAERGLDPTAVAFVYGSTTQAVRNLRGRSGLDPDTGLSKRQRRGEQVDGKQMTPRPLTVSGKGAIDSILQELSDVRNPSVA